MSFGFALFCANLAFPQLKKKKKKKEKKYEML